MGSSKTVVAAPPTPAPAPDPAVVAQQQQAAVVQQQTIQQASSTATASLLRQFGAASAMAGANLTTPLAAMAGPFANSPAATGALAGAK